MQPRDLLATANELVRSTNKPRQSNLLRAVSTAYYALFHALARCCADLMIGGGGATRSKHAWKQVYRSLEHGKAHEACRNAKVVSRFPKQIQDFADMFVTMQEKRHLADYDPYHREFKSAVQIDISSAEKVISEFGQAPLKDRRAFAAFVLFRNRR